MLKRITLSFLFLFTLIAAYTQTIKLRQLEWAPGANYCITTDANGIQYYTLDCPGLLDTVYYVPDTLIIVQETDTIRILIRDLDTDKQRVDTFRILGHELQLSLERDSQAVRTVDLTPYLDNTDNQYIDTLLLVGNELRISLFGDERAYSSILLPVYTDQQRVDTFQIVGHQLQLSLERDSQAVRTVDLTPYTIDNYVDTLFFADSTLTIGRTGALPNLTTVIKDHDWYKKNTNLVPSSISDTIWTNGAIGINRQAVGNYTIDALGVFRLLDNNNNLLINTNINANVSGASYNYIFGPNIPGILISTANTIFGYQNLNSANTNNINYNLLSGYQNYFSSTGVAYTTSSGFRNFYSAISVGQRNFSAGQENFYTLINATAQNDNFTNGYRNFFLATSGNGSNFGNGQSNFYSTTSPSYNFGNGRDNFSLGGGTMQYNFGSGYRNGQYMAGQTAITALGFDNARYFTGGGYSLLSGGLNANGVNGVSNAVLYSLLVGYQNYHVGTEITQSYGIGVQNALNAGSVSFSFIAGGENFNTATSLTHAMGHGYRIGYNATDLTVNNVVAIGNEALSTASSLDNVTAIGWKAGPSNSFSYVTLLGDTARATATRQFAVSNYYQTAKLKNYLLNIDQDTTNKDYYPLALNQGTKEIELRRMYLDTFQLVGNQLRVSIVGDGEAYKTVDLSAYAGTDTDDQFVDTFQIVANKLRISLDNDGRGYSEVDLTPYVGSDTDDQWADTFAIVSHILRLSIDGDGRPFTGVDLSPYLDNTDNQTLTWNTGLRLLTISSGNSVTIDDNYLTAASYNFSTGVLTHDMTGTLPDVLVTVKDHDWYKAGSTLLAENINDNIYTNNNVGINVINPNYTIHALGRFWLFDAAQNYVNGANLPTNNTGGKNWISGEGNMTSSTGAHMNFIAGFNNFPNAGAASWNVIMGWLIGNYGNPAFSGVFNHFEGIENADKATTASYNFIHGSQSFINATTASNNIAMAGADNLNGNPSYHVALGDSNLPKSNGSVFFAQGWDNLLELTSGNSVLVQGHENGDAVTSASYTVIQGFNNADSTRTLFNTFIQGESNLVRLKSSCSYCYAFGTANLVGTVDQSAGTYSQMVAIGQANFNTAGARFGLLGIGIKNYEQVADTTSRHLIGLGIYNAHNMVSARSMVLIGDSILVSADDTTGTYSVVVGHNALANAEAVDTILALGLGPGSGNQFSNVALIGTNATATRRSQFAIGEYESAKLRNYQFNIDQDTTGKTNWVLRLKASGEIELDEPEGQSRSYWNDTTGVLIVNIDTMDLDNRYQWNVGAAGDYTLIGDQPNPENVNFVGTGGITASRSGNTITLDGAALGNTDLTWSGAGPYTLNSSSGTDVTVTALSGIILSGTSTNLNVSGAGLQWNLGANSSYTLIGDAGSAENVNFTGAGGIALSRSGNGITVDGTNTGWNVWVNSSFRNFMSYNDAMDFIAGSGISIGYTFAAGGGNMTITNTGDLSNTNEGSLSVSVGTSTTSIINSNTSGSGSITLQAGSNITLSEAGNVITIASASSSYTSWALWVQGGFVDDISNGEVLDIAVGAGMTTGWNGTTLTLGVTDQSITNEGRLGVGAGGAGTATLTTNTSGSNAVTFSTTSGISISETTSTNGGTITISNDGYLSLTTGSSTFFNLVNNVPNDFVNQFIFTGGITVSVSNSGNSGSVTIDGSLASDARIKKDVKAIKDPYKLINALNPVTFKYTEDWLKIMGESVNNDHTHYSFIAQELKEVLPGNVYTSAHQLNGENILSITTDQVSVITTAAVKQLIQDMQDMQKKIEHLEKELRRQKGKK